MRCPSQPRGTRTMVWYQSVAEVLANRRVGGDVVEAGRHGHLGGVGERAPEPFPRPALTGSVEPEPPERSATCTPRRRCPGVGAWGPPADVLGWLARDWLTILYRRNPAAPTRFVVSHGRPEVASGCHVLPCPPTMPLPTPCRRRSLTDEPRRRRAGRHPPSTTSPGVRGRPVDGLQDVLASGPGERRDGRAGPHGGPRLGYRASPPARALSTGRSSMVALQIPDVTNPVYFDITRGAEDAAAEAGYTLLLADFRSRAGWSVRRSTGRCRPWRGSSWAARASRTRRSGWRPSSGRRWSSTAPSPTSRAW